MKGVTIGADPELFLRNKDGDFIPPTDLIGGTKEHPLKVKYGALQEDCCCAEINIQPATTSSTFVRNTMAVLDTLQKRMSKYDLH